MKELCEVCDHCLYGGIYVVLQPIWKLLKVTQDNFYLDGIEIHDVGRGVDYSSV